MFALTGVLVVAPVLAVTTMFAQPFYCDPYTQNCGTVNNQNTYNPYLTNPNLGAQQHAYNEAFNNFYTQYRNQPVRMDIGPGGPNGNNQNHGQVNQPVDQSWLQRSSARSRSLINYQDPIYPPYGENGTSFGYPYQGYNPNYYGSTSSARSSVYYAQSTNMNMWVQYLSQERYMECMQDVVERREQDVQDVYGDYHRQYEQLLLERSQGRITTWQITDSRRRRDRERQVDRDFRERFRDLERWLDDREDDIEDAYRNDSRECDRVRKEMERQERDQERELQRASR